MNSQNSAHSYTEGAEIETNTNKLANKIISEMQSHNLTYVEMLEILKIIREKLILKKPNFVNDWGK